MQILSIAAKLRRMHEDAQKSLMTSLAVLFPFDRQINPVLFIPS